MHDQRRCIWVTGMNSPFQSAEAAGTGPNKTARTRREFLNYTWAGAIGLLTVQLAGMGYFLAMPRFREGEFGGVIPLDPSEDIPHFAASPIHIAEGRFWMARTETGVLALYRVCTHLDCLVHWDDQQGTFLCPCHGSRFAENGDYLYGPAPRGLDRFVTQVASPDGTILAETDIKTGAPLPLPETVESDTSDTLDTELAMQVDTGRLIFGPG